MSKINITSIGSLTNEQSVLAAFAANETEIETKSDTFLSRVGTAPNQMAASLDMNGNRILNLPSPVASTEPIRLADVSTLSTGPAGPAGPAGSNGTNGTNGLNADVVTWKYTWSTNTASSDPGAGGIKVNNAAPASATALYLSETDADGNGLASEIARWGASATTAGRFRVKIAKNATNFLLLTGTTNVTDNGAWDTFTVTGGALTGSFSNGDTVYVSVAVSGADGSSSGNVSSSSNFTDNRLIRADSPANNATNIQQTGITIDDTDNVSIPTTSSLTVGTIELGAASDTTIARTSAGIIQVEGVVVPLNTLTGTASVHTAATIELGNASDTTLSRTGAGAIAVEGVGVALNSTSLAHTASQYEVGNASDTTITRTGAGAIAVEGVGVALNSTSLAHTASQYEIGAASDTTLARSAAGQVSIEGVNLGPAITVASKSADYSIAAADANTCILHSSADGNNRTFTIPADNGTIPVGSTLTFVNDHATNTVSIAITTDTLQLAGTATTGTRTLAGKGVATALKITSTKWIISGTGLT